MFNWLQKKEWKNSSAHLLLLSKFYNSNSPNKYYNAEYWEVVLKEKPQKVIEQFIKEGMIETISLEKLLDYKFNMSSLKLILKERNLKVSGKKEELIHRLIENDYQAMINATNDLVLYQCTKNGIQLVEHYTESEKLKKEAVEKDVLNFLKRKEFSKAATTVAQYEALQVFPRGLGIDWKSHNVELDIYLLKIIFEKTPKILKDIVPEQLDKARIAAAMMQLWGTRTAIELLPNDFDTGTYMDRDTVCHMLLMYARYMRNMKDYKEAQIKTVEVSSIDDGISCSACKEINGQKYQLENVPELPYEKCTCTTGCRCMTIASDF